MDSIDCVCGVALPATGRPRLRTIGASRQGVGVAERRSAQEVLDDHLSASLNGSVEDDIARNYAEDVVIVSNWGVEHRGDPLHARAGKWLRSGPRALVARRRAPGTREGVVADDRARAPALRFSSLSSTGMEGLGCLAQTSARGDRRG
jgi:hypothetical protein